MKNKIDTLILQHTRHWIQVIGLVKIISPIYSDDYIKDTCRRMIRQDRLLIHKFGLNYPVTWYTWVVNYKYFKG